MACFLHGYPEEYDSLPDMARHLMSSESDVCSVLVIAVLYVIESSWNP